MSRNFVAIIPARGGSKGLPNKNILELGGHPLIAWSIKFAQISKRFERCIVSTDSHDIAQIATQYGAEVPFLRADELSSDTATSSDVILDVIDRCCIPKEDIFFLLEPTSPYRLLDDFNQVLALYQKPDTQKVVSVTEAVSSSYYFQYLRNKEKPGGHLESILYDKSMNIARRQDIPDSYYLDGTLYSDSVSSFKENPTFLSINTKSIVTNYLSSFEIDNAIDLEMYRAIFNHFGSPFKI